MSRSTALGDRYSRGRAIATIFYGEWCGYLHGRISVPLEANLWKGPFLMPRMQSVCWNLLKQIKQKVLR
jgi:hypothetical protein